MKKLKIYQKKIAYVDESGIDSCLYREYGYAPKGQKIHGIIPGRKYRRTNIIAAKSGKEIIAPMQYNTTMNAALSELWFEQCLLPCLEKGTVIVMDTASFHRKKQLFAISEKNGYDIIFLPSYSPELNPIEKYWAWLKNHLKKILLLFSTFYEAIYECFKVN